MGMVRKRVRYYQQNLLHERQCLITYMQVTQVTSLEGAMMVVSSLLCEGLAGLGVVDISMTRVRVGVVKNTSTVLQLLTFDRGRASCSRRENGASYRYQHMCRYCLVSMEWSSYISRALEFKKKASKRCHNSVPTYIDLMHSMTLPKETLTLLARP